MNTTTNSPMIDAILDDSSALRAKYRATVLNPLSPLFNRDAADAASAAYVAARKTCNWCGRTRKSGCCLGR
jgi:hypothetical protein